MAAKEFAEEGKLVTFGIVPTKPETGYGYIKTGENLNEYGFKVSAFVEKPELDVAKNISKMEVIFGIVEYSCSGPLCLLMS